MQKFCPGYVNAPFKALAEDYPDETAYPFEDFRVEWGPIFHRGRLDGSARVLVIGQDPGQHENVIRRILSGEAGRRVQGFLAKVGISESYVLINALLYSVYGSNGAKYVARAKVRDYRNQWIAGILGSGNVEAVVTFGAMARKAWAEYVKANGDPGLSVANLTHPTFPESAGGTAAEKKANTKKMLAEWNAALPGLHAAIVDKDVPVASLVPYGEQFVPADKVDIPALDLPAGTPAWMYADDGWARRVGTTPAVKRGNITIEVPDGVIP